MNQMAGSMQQGFQSGPGMNNFVNQQRTSFSTPFAREEDTPYFRQPVNPQRHQARHRRIRPSDYRELWKKPATYVASVPFLVYYNLRISTHFLSFPLFGFGHVLHIGVCSAMASFTSSMYYSAYAVFWCLGLYICCRMIWKGQWSKLPSNISILVGALSVALE